MGAGLGRRFWLLLSLSSACFYPPDPYDFTPPSGPSTHVVGSVTILGATSVPPETTARLAGTFTPVFTVPVDASGAFDFASVPPGAYFLTITVPSVVVIESDLKENIAGGGTQVLPPVILTGVGGIRGRVLGAGVPLEHVTVGATQSTGLRTTVSTDAHGQFSFSGLLAGPVTLDITCLSAAAGVSGPLPAPVTGTVSITARYNETLVVPDIDLGPDALAIEQSLARVFAPGIVMLFAPGASGMFVMNESGLLEYPFDGGPATTIAQNLPAVSEMAVDDSEVYLAAPPLGCTDPGVLAIPIASGNPINLSVTPTESTSIAPFDGNAYWTAAQGCGPSSGGTIGEAIMSAPRIGGTPTTLVSNLVFASDLHVDGSGLYWSGPGNSSVPAPDVIFMEPLAGGAPITLRSGTSLSLCGVDDQKLYWWEGTALVAAPKTGGTPVTMVAASEEAEFAQVTSRGVYWLAAGTLTFQASGVAPAPILTNFPSTPNIAITDTDVYWSVDGLLMTMPLP